MEEIRRILGKDKDLLLTLVNKSDILLKNVVIKEQIWIRI